MSGLFAPFAEHDSVLGGGKIQRTTVQPVKRSTSPGQPPFQTESPCLHSNKACTGDGISKDAAGIAKEERRQRYLILMVIFGVL
jgi:hypothetical protein